MLDKERPTLKLVFAPVDPFVSLAQCDIRQDLAYMYMVTRGSTAIQGELISLESCATLSQS